MSGTGGGPTPWMRNMVGGYFVAAVGFGLVAIDDGIWGRTVAYGWFPAYVVAFAAAIGLPLVLLAAATSTVEERARGSLDVLLSTPLPTRQIVLAKWWAAFRQVAPLLPIPTLVVLPLAWTTGRWGMAALVPASLVAWAASTASLGLALATWVPRPARAVGASVGLYTCGVLGWPVLVLALTGGFRAHLLDPDRRQPLLQRLLHHLPGRDAQLLSQTPSAGPASRGS